MRLVTTVNLTTGNTRVRANLVLPVVRFSTYETGDVLVTGDLGLLEDPSHESAIWFTLLECPGFSPYLECFFFRDMVYSRISAQGYLDENDWEHKAKRPEQGYWLRHRLCWEELLSRPTNIAVLQELMASSIDSLIGRTVTENTGV